MQVLKNILAIKFNTVFKIALILILSVYIYFYSQSSGNGRYVLEKNGIIFDKRTGNVYKWDSFTGKKVLHQ